VLRSALPALSMLLACAAYDCGGGEAAPETPESPQPATRSEPPPAPVAATTLAIQVAEHSHEAPARAPHALVHVPEGFVASEPWDLVIFLHGWNGCVNVLMRPGRTRCMEGTGPERDGWDLAGAFDEAGINALFLMPQLAFRRREGSAGRFAEEAYAEGFVNAVAERVEPWPTTAPRRIVVAAHSAGFESALAWIEHGGLPIDEVILFDALYAGTETFARWASIAGRRLVSIHTGRGSTARQSRRLARLAQRAGLAVGQSLSADAPVVVMETSAPHREVPRAHLADCLGADRPRTSATENQ